MGGMRLLIPDLEGVGRGEWKDPPPQPACLPQQGPVMGYFYLSLLTVQAQGRQTVAVACGNWPMSHLVTALARWQLPLGSWSRLGLVGKGRVPPLLGCVGVRKGSLKLREARGPQKGTGGGGTG